MSLPQVDGVNFRPVVGYEGYAVGDDGSVWSRHKWGFGAPGLTDKWRKMRPVPMGKRRVPVITLVGPGGRKLLYVHRLVLEAFVGRCPEGLECCHGDGDTSNNRLSNLRWDTTKANMADRTRHGRTVRGSTSVLAKLNEQQIREIRNKYVRGKYGYRTLALEYGVCQTLIRKIIDREIWTHVA